MPHLERWCPAYPHANSHATALVATRGPRELPPGHGPPAPHPFGPPCRSCMEDPTQPWTSVPAVQPPRVALRVNQAGPLRDGAAGQHPPALRGFCIPTQCACWHSTSTQAHRTSTRPPPWYPQRWLPWVAQAILGPARLVSTTPPTQPGGSFKRFYQIICFYVFS